MKNHRFILLFLFCLSLSPLLGQQNYKVLLQTGPFVPAENGADFVSGPSYSPSEVIQGRYYRVVQFYNLPSPAEHQALEASDIRLLDYIPHHAYIVSLPVGIKSETLRAFGIRAVFGLSIENKVSKDLLSLSNSAFSNENVEVIISYPDDISILTVAPLLQAQNVQVIYQSDQHHILKANIRYSQLTDLGTLPYISYIEPFIEEVEEIFESRGLIQSNFVGNPVNGVNGYNGAGVHIGMNDLRYMHVHHIDFKGRTNIGVRNSGPPTVGRQHATHVAGIVGGSGNLIPQFRGMASEVNIYNYQGLGNSTTIFNNVSGAVGQGVTISQTSTGWSCFPGRSLGIYNSSARNADQDLISFPQFMHVFSAGNLGNEDVSGCGGLGIGWRSISGGGKAGKNVLAVGSLTTVGTRSSFSSRGPTQDNRIKPDICAMGTSVTSTDSTGGYISLQGTSMSAPAITGLLAQLTEAYIDMYGEQPDGALMKAILLNTADDVGNNGPDYAYGWGKANGRKFMEVLKNKRFMDSTINLNQTHSISFDIPAGISKAKIMLYWPDEPGAANASVSLVNNLDLVVKEGNNNSFLPWKLDPGTSPSVGSVQQTATKGIDNINNVEQVEIDNPAAGTYQLEVNGKTVPFSDQKYYVVFEYVQDDIVVTFPAGKESILPNEDITLRWEALGDSVPFSIDYTIDDGANWVNISNNVPATQRHFFWQAPASATGQARIRVTRATQADESDANFTIIAAPGNIQFPRVCQDFVTMTWDAVQGATEYDVYLLGEKFMDSIGTTTATFFEPKIRYQDENWFSVRARGSNGIIGRRAIAVRLAPSQLVNCAAVAPTALFDTDTIVCLNDRVFLLDASLKSPDIWGWSINPPTASFANGTNAQSQNPVVVFTQPDTFTVTLSVNNVAGSNAISRRIIVLAPATADFGSTTNGNDVNFDNRSTNATAYHWDFGDGDTSVVASPTHTYAAPGSYTVTLTVSSPCGVQTFTQDVQAWATGIREELEGLKISIAPNPSSGKFQLELAGELASYYHLSMQNLQGQSLFETEIQASGEHFSRDFDFSKLPVGLYFLKLSDGNQRASLKVVIQ